MRLSPLFCASIPRLCMSAAAVYFFTEDSAGQEVMDMPLLFVGPKAVRAEEEEEWPQMPLMAEQLSDKGPHARLALLWHNFKIARRHIGRLQALEAQADAEVNPMHVVQKDETLASIAKVTPFRRAQTRRSHSVCSASPTAPRIL